MPTSDDRNQLVLSADQRGKPLACAVRNEIVACAMEQIDWAGDIADPQIGSKRLFEQRAWYKRVVLPDNLFQAEVWRLEDEQARPV
jgi:hypothetical protein